MHNLLVVDQVLLAGEALPTGAANHKATTATFATFLAPAPLLFAGGREVGGPCTLYVTVASQMAAEGSEAGIVVPADRALIHFTVILIVTTFVVHPLAAATSATSSSMAAAVRVTPTSSATTSTTPTVLHLVLATALATRVLHAATGHGASLAMVAHVAIGHPSLASLWAHVGLDTRNVGVHLSTVGTHVSIGPAAL